MVETAYTQRKRDWMPVALERYIHEKADAFARLGSDETEHRILELVDAHERHLDRQSIGLNAGTNVMNPRAAALLSRGLGNRPSLGYPGDKYETGMEYAEQIEIATEMLVKKLFGARYAEIRVGSGALANLYTYMATTKPGDTIMAFSGAAAGHVTHHREGAAGLYGLEIHDVPYDAANMTVDLDGLRREVKQLRPKLIVIAGSLCLFPYPVAEVRQIADEVGAWLLYDAAHMSGMIAGGRFQQPLAEGAHVMTMSTYKSYGGPSQGLALTDEPELARRLDQIAYPGLTANFDLGNTAALALATLDLLEYGEAYAGACISNAAALGAALEAEGLPVHGVEGRGHTASHQLAIHAEPLGGGQKASRHLSRANIQSCGIGLPIPEMDGDFNGIRLGTQEVTRWGMKPADMTDIARLIARVWIENEAPETVRPDVIAFRKAYQEMRFVR